MSLQWDDNINSFIELANDQEVRMIMVGSGAMDFYKYKIPSAGNEFWIEATTKNINKIILILQKMGSEIVSFPFPINRKQNISVEFFPSCTIMELITDFVIEKSFSWAFDDSVETALQNHPNVKWRVISLEDLIVSKTNSHDTKDLMELQELKRLNGN